MHFMIFWLEVTTATLGGNLLLCEKGFWVKIGTKYDYDTLKKNIFWKRKVFAPMSSL